MTSRAPIRIGYLIATLDPGGSERQMLALIERLPRPEFEPTIILFRRTGSLLERASATATVRVLHGSVGRAPVSAAAKAVRGIEISFGLARHLRDHRYDIIDAWLFHAYVAAALSRPVTRIPHLVAGRRSLHDARGALGPFDRLISAAANALTDAIVANSEAVREDAIAQGDDPGKIRVIQNGVEVRPRLSRSERREIRSRWGVDEQSLVIAVIANYKLGKGLEPAIRALANVTTASGARPVLVLMGEGPLRASLGATAAARGVGDRVRLVGHEPAPEIAVGAADVLLHASRSEGLPNAVLEASAAGVPVVATRVGGTPEIVVDGVTGFLVDLDDEAAMTERLVRLTESHELRHQLGDAGATWVRSRFSMDRMVSGFADLYRELAGRDGRS